MVGRLGLLRIHSFWISHSNLLAGVMHWHCIVGRTIKRTTSFGLDIVIHFNYSVLDAYSDFFSFPSPKPKGRMIYEKSYSNEGVAAFEDQLRRFISESGHCPMMACIAIAGPVSKNP